MLAGVDQSIGRSTRKPGLNQDEKRCTKSASVPASSLSSRKAREQVLAHAHQRRRAARRLVEPPDQLLPARLGGEMQLGHGLLRSVRRIGLDGALQALMVAAELVDQAAQEHEARLAVERLVAGEHRARERDARSLAAPGQQGFAELLEIGAVARRAAPEAQQRSAALRDAGKKVAEEGVAHPPEGSVWSHIAIAHRAGVGEGGGVLGAAHRGRICAIEPRPLTASVAGIVGDANLARRDALGAIISAAVILAAALGSTVSFAPALAEGSAGADARDRTLTVRGSAKVMADADLATLSVEVSAEGSFAQDAMNAIRGKLRNLNAALHDAGVADADIGQSLPQLTPHFSAPPAPSRQPSATGPATDPAAGLPRLPPAAPTLRRDSYVASVNLRIRTRNFAEIGVLTDRIADHADGHLPSMSLTIEDPQRFIDEARRKALDDAGHLAAVEAERMHLRLGAVRAIREQPSQDRLADLLERFAQSASGGGARPIGDFGASARPATSGSQQAFLASLEVEWAVEP